MIPGMEEKQDRAFAAHVRDLFTIAQEKHITRFSAFLDLHQALLARRLAASAGYDNYVFFAGHPDGERVMLGVFAPFEEPADWAFPIEPLTVSFREEDALGHRDFLGSLTGLQIGREAVGDILVEQGRAVLFVSDKIAPLIQSELTKVGRCGVRVTRGYTEPLPVLHRYEDRVANVPSLRLDCLVASVTKLSREKSAQMIRAQLVSVNGAVKTETSWNLDEGDVLSICGYGKFLFAQVAHTTKKGRLQILCKKYV